MKKNTDNARVLIDKIHLQNEPLYDLRTSDMEYIHTKNKDKDLSYLMYDCYKLGFARGMKYNEAKQAKG